MLAALFLLSLAATASAAVHQINVGENSTLTYTPDSFTAEVGDMLEFHFVGGFHDVVRGNYDKPCEPFSSESGFGFASGRVQGKTEKVRKMFLSVQPWSASALLPSHYFQRGWCEHYAKDHTYME